ncbi:hypothetical protein DB313_04715 (plasmid) [Borrelia turcica IST7]|uniref:Uncharacterized protein n=1 Tax=Borrelia turcica IST7 TaxID=1104446 RepID=A0A386PMJ6_9SPIR|nr:hypothetical protein [Borrelia turcica]AYE36804.1 hypothetical protein DB313_04715 [Borrelia turcica IST7]
MRIIFLSLSLAIMLIIALSFALVIVNVYAERPSSTPSEEIEIINQSNTDAVKFKIALINQLGSVAIVYDYKGADKRFYLDFEIITDNEPLNLVGVSLNGVDIEQEVLLTSSQLKFEDGQYILSFDDSIPKTGFFVDLDSRDEYLKLAEFARGDGIKFCVKCIERRTGVVRNISFKLSLEKGKKFFDLIEEYGKNVKGFMG